MIRYLVILACLVSLRVQAQRSLQGQALPAPSSNTLDAYWAISPIPSDGRTVLVLSESVIPAASSLSSEIVLNQTGNNNVAQLSASAQNRLQLTQTNNDNSANATLSGTGNSLLMNQTGGANNLTIQLGGSGNRYLISQDGGDVATFSGISQTNTRMELVQKAGNNTFITDNSVLTNPFSNGIQNLRIEQSGGASIRVQQGSVLPTP